jgi:polysaccharide pyruvyl transferase WcaK-like protein
MKMSNVSLCGFYGFNNYGDTLMLDCLSSFLRSSGLSVSVFSDRKSDESFCYKKVGPNKSDIIALGGGGIITQNFWYIKEGLYKYLRDDQKLILLNVNLTSESVPVLALLKDKISLAVVRDRFSYDLALKFLMDESKVILASDISYIYNVKKINEGYTDSLSDKKEKKVSVCLNSYIFKDYFSNDSRQRIYAEKAIIEISEFLKWMKTFNHKVQLVPSQVDTEVNDNTIHGILNGYIGGANKWIYTNEHIEHNLKNSSLIISARYHTTLFAIKNSIPFIDITHHSKNSNLLKDLGLQEFSINYWKIGLEELKKKAFEAQNSDLISEISSSYGVSSREDWSKVLEKIHILIQ